MPSELLVEQRHTNREQPPLHIHQKLKSLVLQLLIAKYLTELIKFDGLPVMHVGTILKDSGVLVAEKLFESLSKFYQRVLRIKLLSKTLEMKKVKSAQLKVYLLKDFRRIAS